MDWEEAIRERLLPFRDGQALRPNRLLNETDAIPHQPQEKLKATAGSDEDNDWEQFALCAGVWWGKFITKWRYSTMAGLWGFIYINYLIGRLDEMPPEFVNIIPASLRQELAHHIMYEFNDVWKKVDYRVEQNWNTPIRFRHLFSLMWEREKEKPPLWATWTGDYVPEAVYEVIDKSSRVWYSPFR